MAISGDKAHMCVNIPLHLVSLPDVSRAVPVGDPVLQMFDTAASSEYSKVT
ncbi:hypothetical protein [Mycolicibacterium sp. CBMA 226]|uniref:hypothetical protein n=1 Tax=Mycolicibacterium sp. CBMA 226 TaxID=2606611 RepID=UPI0012DE38FE|nr:hypothetical protein [Mycolicibacterium sp. CBMA 226]